MRKNTMAIILSFLLVIISGTQALAKTNNPPKISTLTTSIPSIKAQEKIKLTVVAKDVDKDKLTYQWLQTNNSAEKGSFSGSGATVYWTAPRVSEEKRIVLQVKVLDSKKAAATKSITITVNPKLMTQLYEELKESAVFIKTDKGLGSGFVYSKDGLILTCFHVIRGASKVEVTFSSGRKYSADILYNASPVDDWAILKINATNLKPVNLQRAANKIGEEVFTIGNPQGLGWSMSSGIVSDNARELYGAKYIQTTAPVNPGNSGGPLFNRKGEVVGIVASKYNNSENLNFAIPISTVDFSNKDLINTKMNEYFSHDNIMERIDILADVLNEPNNGIIDFLKLGSTDFGKVEFINGSWEDENKNVFYGLEAQVSYEQFLKLLQAHKESEEFNEEFGLNSYSLTNITYFVSGADFADFYVVVADSLDSPPPASLIPSTNVKYENGKYKIYWNFYFVTMDSTGAEEFWNTDI